MNVKGKIKLSVVTKERYIQNLTNFNYSLFVSSEWVESYRGEEDTEIQYFEFYDNGATVGKLAGLLRKNSGIGRKYLFFYAGPAINVDSEELYNQCLYALYKYARKKGYSRINIQFLDQQYLYKCRIKGYYKKSAGEFVKFFTKGDEQPEFGKSFRYNVRKATKVGASFHCESSRRVFNRLIELIDETQKLRKGRWGEGFTPYSYAFMHKGTLDRLFESGIMRLYHVEMDGVIHCVRCSMDDGKRVYGLMIGADAMAYKNSLQHFLQFNLINLLQNKGYGYYNIATADNTENGAGLVQYKESLGCVQRNVQGVYTHFLCFPQNIINPVMDFGRLLLKNKKLSKIVKFASEIVSGKDMD